MHTSSPNMSSKSSHRSRASAIASGSPPRAPLPASVAAAASMNSSSGGGGGGGGINNGYYHNNSSGNTPPVVYGASSGGTPYAYSPAGSIGGSVYGTPSSQPSNSPPRHPNSSNGNSSSNSNSGYGKSTPSGGGGGGLLSGLGGFSLGGITKALATAVETQISPAVSGIVSNVNRAAYPNSYSNSANSNAVESGGAGGSSSQGGLPKVSLNFASTGGTTATTAGRLTRRHSSFTGSDTSDTDGGYSGTYNNNSTSTSTTSGGVPVFQSAEEREEAQAQLAPKLASMRLQRPNNHSGLVIAINEYSCSPASNHDFKFGWYRQYSERERAFKIPGTDGRLPHYAPSVDDLGAVICLKCSDVFGFNMSKIFTTKIETVDPALISVVEHAIEEGRYFVKKTVVAVNAKLQTSKGTSNSSTSAADGSANRSSVVAGGEEYDCITELAGSVEVTPSGVLISERGCRDDSGLLIAPSSRLRVRCVYPTSFQIRVPLTVVEKRVNASPLPPQSFDEFDEEYVAAKQPSVRWLGDSTGELFEVLDPIVHEHQARYEAAQKRRRQMDERRARSSSARSVLLGQPLPQQQQQPEPFEALVESRNDTADASVSSSTATAADATTTTVLGDATTTSAITTSTATSTAQEDGCAMMDVSTVSSDDGSAIVMDSSNHIYSDDINSNNASTTTATSTATSSNANTSTNATIHYEEDDVVANQEVASYDPSVVLVSSSLYNNTSSSNSSTSTSTTTSAYNTSGMRKASPGSSSNSMKTDIERQLYEEVSLSLSHDSDPGDIFGMTSTSGTSGHDRLPEELMIQVFCRDRQTRDAMVLCIRSLVAGSSMLPNMLMPPDITLASPSAFKTVEQRKSLLPWHQLPLLQHASHTSSSTSSSSSSTGTSGGNFPYDAAPHVVLKDLSSAVLRSTSEEHKLVAVTAAQEEEGGKSNNSTSNSYSTGSTSSSGNSSGTNTNTAELRQMISDLECNIALNTKLSDQQNINISNLEYQIKALQSDLSSKDAELGRLRVKVDQQQMESRLAASRQSETIDLLRFHLEEEKEVVADKTKEISALQASLTDQSLVVASLEADLARLQVVVSDANKSMGDASEVHATEVAKLERELKSISLKSESQTKSLSDELDATKESLCEYMNKYEHVLREAEDARNRLALQEQQMDVQATMHQQQLQQMQVQLQQQMQVQQQQQARSPLPPTIMQQQHSSPSDTNTSSSNSNSTSSTRTPAQMLRDCVERVESEGVIVTGIEIDVLRLFSKRWTRVITTTHDDQIVPPTDDAEAFVASEEYLLRRQLKEYLSTSNTSSNTSSKEEEEEEDVIVDSNEDGTTTVTTSINPVDATIEGMAHVRDMLAQRDEEIARLKEQLVELLASTSTSATSASTATAATADSQEKVGKEVAMNVSTDMQRELDDARALIDGLKVELATAQTTLSNTNSDSSSISAQQEALVAELEALRADLISHKDRLQEAERAIADGAASNKALVVEVSEYRDQLVTKATECEALRADKISLQSTIDAIHNDKDKLEFDLKAALADRDKATKECVTVKTDLESKLSTSSDTITALKAELSSKQRQIVDMEDRIIAMQSRFDSEQADLQAQLDAQTARSDEQEVRVVHLEQEVLMASDSRQALAQQTQVNEDLKRQIKNLRQQLLEADQEAQSMRAILSEKHDIGDSLIGENVKLKAEIETLRNTLEKRKQRIEKLKQSTAELDKTLAHNKTLTEDNARLSKAVETLEFDRKELNTLRPQVAKLEASNADIKYQKDLLTNQTKRQAEELSSNAILIRDLEAHIQSYEREVVQQEEKCECLGMHAEELRSSLLKQYATIVALESTNASLREEVLAANAADPQEVQGLQLGLSKVQGERNYWENKAKSLSRDLNRKLMAGTPLQRELARTTARIEELENERNAYREAMLLACDTFVPQPSVWFND